jgi:PIN domain nuclease of toxin-antitoxin system
VGVSRLLLDTHALLWTLLAPDQIPRRALDRIRDARTQVVVSAATAWEIATKYRLGKLDGAEAVVHAYHDHLDRLRVGELPITSAHALSAGGLTWEHRDPFDRIIVAQAMAGALPIVTADRAIAAFPGVRTVW